MARNWNTTGLYKASRDRNPAKRSRRIRGTPPTATLVPIDYGPTCKDCGTYVTSRIHAMFCQTGSVRSPDTGKANG